MPVLLKDITTPDKAKALFVDRRTSLNIASTDFYEGDHWQKGLGWIGAAPTDGDTNVLTYIQSAFVSENAIAEVVDRHVAGVLGREPLWGFIPQEMVAVSTQARRKRFAKRIGLSADTSTPDTSTSPPAEDKVAQEADDALTVWWNQGRPREQLKQALVSALNEERALIRFFIPRGLLDANGRVPVQRDLASALDLIHVQVVAGDKGGVFVDDDTQQEFGVYTYQLDGNAFVELTYVDRGTGLTVFRTLQEDKAPVDADPIDLQGRLWMYEVKRKALITEQVKSNQRSLNLALTMMMRNVNLAGSLERTILNAELPTEIVRVSDGSERGYREERRPSALPVGAGATNFLNGVLIKNENNQIIGRANPNISFRDPVKIDTFTGTRDQFYASILGQCQQRFALISGDATTSGRSREQARAEFESSLKDTADVIDDAGRYMLETPLRIAAHFCNQSAKFAGLRCDFTSIIETGPIGAEDRKANRDDVAVKLMSKETAMSNNGIDDTDAELERIRAEEEVNPASEPIQNLPPNQQGQQPGLVG